LPSSDLARYRLGIIAGIAALRPSSNRELLHDKGAIRAPRHEKPGGPPAFWKIIANRASAG
jgi:hypothetical protein